MQADDRYEVRVTVSASSAPALGAVPRVRWAPLRNSSSANEPEVAPASPEKSGRRLEALRRSDAVLAKQRQDLLNDYPGWTVWSDERADSVPALHRHRRLVRLNAEAWREYNQPESKQNIGWPRYERGRPRQAADEPREP